MFNPTPRTDIALANAYRNHLTAEDIRTRLAKVRAERADLMEKIREHAAAAAVATNDDDRRRHATIEGETRDRAARLEGQAAALDAALRQPSIATPYGVLSGPARTVSFWIDDETNVPHTFVLTASPAVWWMPNPIRVNGQFIARALADLLVADHDGTLTVAAREWAADSLARETTVTDVSEVGPARAAERIRFNFPGGMKAFLAGAHAAV